MPRHSAAPPLPSAEDILKVLAEQPRSLRQLLKALNLRAGQRMAFNRHLQTLVDERRILRLKGGELAPAPRVDLLVGRILRKQAEFAVFVPETPGRPELSVAMADLGGALHDDTVSVRPLAGGPGRDGRRPARVVRVLRRGHDRVVGTLRKQKPYALIAPDNFRFTPDFVVPADALGAAKDGEKVVAEITAWPEGFVPGRARITEVLGRPGQTGMDITVIVRKHELPYEYSAAGLAEAARIAREPGPAELAGRRDLRGLPIVTIDGEDARDFDDAVHCEELPDGGWRLGVHIADVSHYLREGTPLDLEARERGTSVYFPDRALHMLPEPLSTGVCSLRPQVDRLTVSAVMDVAPDGKVGRTDFFRSVIRSAARLTYNQVQAVLAPAPAPAGPRSPYQAPAPDAAAAGPAGPNPAEPFRAELTRLHEAALALRRERDARGSLDFDLPEPKVILDAAGRVLAVERRVQLASHKLIEDCMIAANEAVARYLLRTDTPTLYRVHEMPSGEKYEELQVFLKTFQYALEPFSPRQASKAYQKLLRSWQGTPEEPMLNMALLRSLKLAVYQPRNAGHFGLGSECYAHFTSPIRRYPDLIVHRTLTARLDGTLGSRQLAEWREKMPGWGEQLSLAERRAEKAEREAVAVKQAEFMAELVGETFTGVISNVTTFGFFVTLDEHFVEGLVKLGALEDDYYNFDARRRILVGDRRRRTFAAGQSVQVRVVRVNPAEGWVDFALAGPQAATRPAPNRAARRRGSNKGRRR